MRCGRSVADPPDDPVVVEAVGEVAQGAVELGDGAESAKPEQLFLQVRMNLPVLKHWAAVSLGLAYEGRARPDAEGLELVLEGVQELLGHQSLSSTQVYTHLAQGKMRADYDKAHPRAEAS